MKIIILLAVVAVLLLFLSGAISQSSVGGPLTLMLVFFLAMLAVGIHEAWLKKRGTLGWIVSIVVSIIGGFVAAGFGGLAMERILSLLHFEGSLASSQHPLLYILSAGMMIVTVFGSWIALQIVNRMR